MLSLPDACGGVKTDKDSDLKLWGELEVEWITPNLASLKESKPSKTA